VVTNVFFLLSGIATVILILGLVCLAVSCIGCCGACCSLRLLLMIYAAVVGLLFAVILILTILYSSYRQQLYTMIDDYLLVLIKSDFTGFQSLNAFTLLLSFIHMELHCCGVHGGSDFTSAANWNKAYSNTVGGTTHAATLQYPVSCCKTLNWTPIDYNCISSPDASNSNHLIGCSSKIVEAISSVDSTINTVLSMAVLVSGSLLACTVILIHYIGKSSIINPI